MEFFIRESLSVLKGAEGDNSVLEQQLNKDLLKKRGAFVDTFYKLFTSDHIDGKLWIHVVSIKKKKRRTAAQRRKNRDSAAAVGA